jgi:hypothetical protein
MSELQSQLSVFDEALKRVMDLPGDWHAGMSMLQSIVTLFYDVLLYPICHSVLLWKRFNRETNKCYYQSSRLVNVVHQVLMRFTWHRFIGTKLDLLRESYDDFCDGVENEEQAEQMCNDSANFLCYCANEFQGYLKAELTCGDQWRQMCSAFLLMSSDFVDFVWAYRKCDSIHILLSYQRFAPVWRVVGATRYLERHWRQLETLYTKFSRGGSRSHLVTSSRLETDPRLDPTRRDISRRDVSEISSEISTENSQKAARDQGKGAV